MNNEISAGKLAGGLVLVAIGVLGVMDIAGLHEIARWWPLLLIFLGIGKEVDALRTRHGGGGYILIAVGVWMLVGSLRLFGLRYDDAFPIGIAVAGAGMVLHALLGISGKKESPREQQ